MASLVALPSDLLRYVLLPRCSYSTLFALLFVNTTLNKLVLSSSRWNYDFSRPRLVLDVFKSGYLSILQWLHSRLKYPTLCDFVYSLTCKPLSEAAKNNQRELLEFLIDANPQYSFPPLCDDAASAGHLELLQWLRSREITWTGAAAVGAAASGHLNIILWLQENRYEPVWLRSGGICLNAALNRHDNVLLWYETIEGHTWTPEICHIFAAQGRLDMIIRVREDGCKWLEDTICRAAARGGSIPVLKYLRGVGCPWDVYCCAQAARHGHLEMLQYLHEKGCPWDKTTTARATQSRLEVLQYALAKGCPWDQTEIISAATDPSILNWLQSNGYAYKTA